MVGCSDPHPLGGAVGVPHQCSRADYRLLRGFRAVPVEWSAGVLSRDGPTSVMVCVPAVAVSCEYDALRCHPRGRHIDVSNEGLVRRGTGGGGHTSKESTGTLRARTSQANLLHAMLLPRRKTSTWKVSAAGCWVVVPLYRSRTT